MANSKTKQNTSMRFPKSHREILKLAAKISGRPMNEVAERCLNRSILKCGEKIMAEAQTAALRKTSPLLNLVRHINKERDYTNQSPTGINLPKETFSTLNIATEEGFVTQTEIVMASVQEEVVGAVSEMLVEKYLRADRGTARTLGKWTAHVTQAPDRPKNGYEKLERALMPIAADSSRKSLVRK